MKYILDINNMPLLDKDSHERWLCGRKIDPYKTFWLRCKNPHSRREEGKWLYETEDGEQIFTKEDFFKPLLIKDLSEYM